MNDSTNNRKPYSVSVIIPAHNASEYIGRAIESVLAQTRKPDEIIVVDDGSTDNTAEVTKKYESIRYIHQENAGVSVARNTGIEAAMSEWIAFLDADDEWMPEKLEVQTELLGRNTNLVWTTSNFIRCLCDEARRVPDIDLKQGQKAVMEKDYFDDYFQTQLPHGCGWTGTMLVKRSILQDVGLFQPGMFHGQEDTDLWWRIAYQYPAIGFNTEPLAIYHMNVSQSLTQHRLPHDVYIELIERHLKLSAEHKRDDVFKVKAGRFTRSRIRGLLFENRPAEIRVLMNRFGELLPRRFKTVIRLLLVFPRATAVLCHRISRIVRALNLRKEAVRKPGQIRETSKERTLRPN